MKIMVGNIEYVPKVEIPELTDERLQDALEHLTSIQYFNHKVKYVAWDALYALAPELARLAAENPQAAFERVHGVGEEDEEGYN